MALRALYDHRPRNIVEFDVVIIRELELACSTCDVMVASVANSYDTRLRSIVEFDVLIHGLECAAVLSPASESDRRLTCVAVFSGGATSGKESRANNMSTTCCGAAVSKKMSVGIDATVCSSLGTEAMVCLSLVWDIGLELELV